LENSGKIGTTMEIIRKLVSKLPETIKNIWKIRKAQEIITKSLENIGKIGKANEIIGKLLSELPETINIGKLEKPRK